MEASTGEMFNTVRNLCLKEVRRLSVNSLATETLKAAGRNISAVTGLSWFTSVYDLRRCLVHRGGIVGQDDVDDTWLLTWVWGKLILSFDGKDVPALPFYAEKGGTLSIRFGDEVHKWHPGKKLRLSAEDCQNIGLSLSIFASQVADELQKGLAAMLSSGTDVG